MRKISVYIISIVLLVTGSLVSAQDTIPVVYKIKVGADIIGPGYYIYDHNNLTIEGFISVDIDTNKAVVFETGYHDFKYTQYNYDYQSKGLFFRMGMDFNFLHPQVSKGQYYAGVGLRYGLTVYSYEVPILEYDNYWGTATSSISPSTHAAHFIEVSPGIRTELFRNFSIGFTVRLRLLIYTGTSADLKPIDIPGYGNGTKRLSPGLNYYLIWSIPYKNRQQATGNRQPVIGSQ
jgi:hypothetical protein